MKIKLFEILSYHLSIPSYACIDMSVVYVDMYMKGWNFYCYEYYEYHGIHDIVYMYERVCYEMFVD